MTSNEYYYINISSNFYVNINSYSSQTEYKFNARVMKKEGLKISKNEYRELPLIELNSYKNKEFKIKIYKKN
jgi:hypothetical protein